MCADGWQGRCERSGANPRFCGAKACFLFTPSVVCPHVCVHPALASHHRVEWCASRLLVVWRQRIIISLEARTEWSLQPPPPPPAAVCFNLHAPVIFHAQCVCVCQKDQSSIKTSPTERMEPDALFPCCLKRSCRWMSTMLWIWSMRRWY